MAFMIAATLVGTLGVFVSPFYGVAVYYLFAILRPRYLWHWVLPRGIQWSEYVAIATIIAAVVTLASPAGGPGEKERRTYSRVHGAFLLFVAWVGASYLAAQSQAVAWPWFIEYSKIFLMFFVSALLIRTVHQIWALVIIAALAIGYIAYEVNFLYFQSGYLGIYHNGFGGLDNNGAGLMLAMGVPLCIFIFTGTTRWWRWIFAALIPVLLHAVLMTYSRGAMVALLVASPFVLLRSNNRKQLAIAAVAIALALPLLAGQEIRREFFSVESYEEDGSAQSRFISWTAGYHIALDYPIFGVGVRNSNVFSFQYGADKEGRAIHSQFIQILADNGFPALFFYLLTFVWVASSLRKVRRWAQRLETEEQRLAYSSACAIESALAVFCIGGLFLSLEVFELPYLLVLLGAQLPLVLRLHERGAEDVAPPRIEVVTMPPGAAAYGSPHLNT
jgi:probable O-glycosylation ligase (exosortase A-associated)